MSAAARVAGVSVVQVFERCEAYVADAAGFPEQFKPGVVKRDLRQYREAIRTVEAMATNLQQVLPILDAAAQNKPVSMAAGDMARDVRRTLVSATPAGDGESPEDRFEQFVQAEIARSPEPLRELGEYLGHVLDEDQWPKANRLLLQLATAAPARDGEMAHEKDKVRALSEWLHNERPEAERVLWAGDLVRIVRLVMQTTGLPVEQSATVLVAKPLTWEGGDITAGGYREWTESLMGFHIEFEPSEQPEYQFAATWGEGDTEHFATLDEAQAWCQSEADGWVRNCSRLAFCEVPEHVAGILAEVERATRKFPTWPTDPLHAVAVLNEEVGELNRALLQAVYEPHKSKPGDVREEALQAAAMALRFVASLDRYEYGRCPQHEQHAATTQEPPK